MTRLYEWVSKASIKHKLMMVNFMMITVPLVTLTLVTVILLGIFRFGDPVQNRKWVMLFPSQINSLMVQMSMSSIYRAFADDDMGLSDLRIPISLLEVQGADVVVAKDGVVQYATQHTNGPELYERLLTLVRAEKNPTDGQVIITSDIIALDLLEWDGDQFHYIVESTHGWGIYSEGDIPFLTKSLTNESFEKQAMEAVVGAGILLFLIAIILQGLYLSQIVSSMILKPLESLQEAAQAIKRGDLNQTLQVDSNDELGETCAIFDTMRQELKNNVAHREQMEQQRRAMIAGISHDLATPLTAVKGFASAFKDGIVKTPEQQERYANRIVDRANVMESLIKQLSDFSKFEMSQVPLEMQRMDMNAYLHEFLAERKDLYAERNVHIRAHLLDDMAPHSSQVDLDPMQFERVLTNILENSLKYSPHGESTVDMILSVRGKSLVLTLGDYGNGVSDNEIDKLFDLFYRADAARTNVASGNGLGLAIVKQIVEAMGGTVYAMNRTTLDYTQTGFIIEIALPIV